MAPVEAIALIGVSALIAGVVQGTTGFGGAICVMMVLPYVFSMPVAAGISSIICLGLNLQMAVMYRKHLDRKLLFRPILVTVIVASIVISLSTSIDGVIAKKALGVFFIVLCIYYLFIKKDTPHGHPLGLLAGIVCVVTSGACDGMFGVGGPLMVVYFMAATRDHPSYLAAIQTYFAFANVYYTVFRVATGVLTVEVVPAALVGVAGIFVGGLVAGKLVRVLDHNLVERAVYVMLGVAGVINLI